MGKIIFLDVDGTLINYEAKMPASAEAAVEAARANGHRVYLCTGCSKAEIELRHLCEVDGMIGANGGYVEDAGKVILHDGLKPDTERRLVDWCLARNLGFYLEANSGLYCNDGMLSQGPAVMNRYALGKGADPAQAAQITKDFFVGFQLLSGEDLYRDDVNKISFILSSYQDYLDAREEFAGMEVNTWGGRGEAALFGDVGPAGITKAHAVEVLLAYLGADRADTISFGDAKIDLSMFDCCGYNVAMGNGGPEIRAAADYVTSDVDDDGLYRAFEHLGLI